MAKMDAAKVKATTDMPTKAGILNRPRSSIGWAVSRSLTTKAAMSRAEPTNKATIVVLPQPRSLPRTSPKTSRNRLPENVTKPTQSMRRRRSSRDSATLARVRKMATTPMGTLTKKIQRHPMALVMAPPTAVRWPRHRR